MDCSKYIGEINLIKKQNNTERDLYSLVKQTLEPYLCGLSLRIVAERRKSELGQIFYGISSVPDIAILDEDFNNEDNKDINKENREKLKGCVEVKNLGEKLCELNELKKKFEKGNVGTDEGQLLGEILWYKKLLYTNGTEWKLFTFNGSEKFDGGIIEIVNNRISAEKEKEDFDWTKEPCLPEIIEKNIEETPITKDCTKNWDEFIKNLKKINWQQPRTVVAQ